MAVQKRLRTGDLLLTSANAYVDAFVREAVAMLWSARKDILQINIPWVEKECGDGILQTYREYHGSVSVVHDGLVVDVVFTIDLFPEGGETMNAFGWSPRNRLFCRIRSLPEVKGIEVDFDLEAAAGQMIPQKNKVIPVEAIPKQSGITPHNLALIRKELGVSAKLQAI